MSSQDEAFDTNRLEKPSKKKRGRACDACRQKKIRCDGAHGQRCANCVTGGYECTYIGAAKKRYPDVAYMEQLETQLDNMKKLLNKLHPGVDFSSELNSVVNGNSLWRVEPMQSATQPWTRQPSVSISTPTLPFSPVPHLAERSGGTQDEVDLGSSDEECAAQQLYRRRSDTWRLKGSRPRFLGKSSRFMFVQKALDYRYQYAGETTGETSFTPRPRAQYWNLQKWLAPSLDPEPPYPAECFPTPDLLTDLVECYFCQYNICLPLLHRPTFEEHLKNGLHLTDDGFGSTVLLVCAIGARFSTDERVLMEEEILPSSSDEIQTWQSAGWKWFTQVQITRKAMSLHPPRLFDLQTLCLAATYLYASSISQPAWPLIGIGLRLAQDLGAHRKKMYKPTPNVEDEQLKRAFWVLIMVDRSLSSGLGRPCCLQDEDFDLDLPIECDDEYWTNSDPSLAFKQPPGKPSFVSFFTCIIRLKQVHAYALRTLYATNRAKAVRGYGGIEWEQNIVSELDSALNSFIDSVPDHLRWDPHREDLNHLAQSAMLYAGYYALQINIHRPFIPSPRKPSRLSFPSLAICTNAARSCIHVLDVHYERTKGKLAYQSQAALFTSGVVLLLNIWGGKLSGSSTNPLKEMAEVHKAMKILKAQEPRWFSAGRYWDVLYDLASVGDLPLPPTPVSHKRPREEALSGTADAPARMHDSATVTGDSPRPLAGSRRVQAYQQQHSPSPPSAGPAENGDFVLPVHTADLGRLPLHSAFGTFGPITEFGANSWYPSIPAQIPTAAALSNGALGSMFTQPFTSQGSIGPTMGAQNQPAPVGPTQFSTELQGMPPAGVTNGSIENMMAAVSMDANPSPFPEFSENDTLAMWSNAPTNFEWDDWGSFISTFGLGETETVPEVPEVV